MEKLIVLFVLSLILCNLSISQAQTKTANNKAKSTNGQKLTNTSTNISTLEKIDSSKVVPSISIKKATDALRVFILRTVVEQLNKNMLTGKRQYKEVIANKEYPIIVSLVNDPNAFADQELADHILPPSPGAPGRVRNITINNNINDVVIGGSIKILVGPFIVFGISSGVAKFSNSSSGIDLSDCVAYLKDGNISFSGYYFVNDIKLFFEKGTVIYNSNYTSGVFEEGSTCILQNERFIFKNSRWNPCDENGTLKDLQNANQEATKIEGEVFNLVDDGPSYPNGMDAFISFIREQIVYPQLARRSGIEGKVMVQFVILASGKITNAHIVKSVGGGCDEEAIRIVNAMPNWNPGKKDGKPVNVRVTLPIIFNLN